MSNHHCLYDGTPLCQIGFLPSATRLLHATLAKASSLPRHAVMLTQNEIFLHLCCESCCHFHWLSHPTRLISKLFEKSRRSLHVFHTCDQPNSLSLLIPQIIGCSWIPHRCCNHALHGALVHLINLPKSSMILTSSVNLLYSSSHVNEISKYTSFSHPTITSALLPSCFVSSYLCDSSIYNPTTSFIAIS